MLLEQKNGEQRHHSWIDLSSGFGDNTPQLKAILLAASADSPSAKRLDQAIWGSGRPIAIHTVTSSTIGRHASLLESGHALPIGDQELVSRCLECARVPKPNWSCYPQALLAHMQHLPRLTTASAALRWPKPVFVRAARDGDFRGFVLREKLDDMPPEDRASLDKLLSSPRSTAVWVASLLEILGVWRYYVLEGELLGYGPVRGRDVPEPESGEVSAIIAAAPHHVPYLLDMAVLVDGTTTLLRTRDTLGIEYPLIPGRHIPTPLDFLRLSWSRWTQLHLNARLNELTPRSPART